MGGEGPVPRVQPLIRRPSQSLVAAAARTFVVIIVAADPGPPLHSYLPLLLLL
jgi:hypothetical protein